MGEHEHEPTVMDCPECLYKHLGDAEHDIGEGNFENAYDDLRDAEHHIEDLTKVTKGEEREKWMLMLDDIRAKRKEVFTFIVKGAKGEKVTYEDEEVKVTDAPCNGSCSSGK